MFLRVSLKSSKDTFNSSSLAWADAAVRPEDFDEARDESREESQEESREDVREDLFDWDVCDLCVAVARPGVCAFRASCTSRIAICFRRFSSLDVIGRRPVFPVSECFNNVSWSGYFHAIDCRDPFDAAVAPPVKEDAGESTEEMSSLAVSELFLTLRARRVAIISGLSSKLSEYSFAAFVRVGFWFVQYC